MANPSPRAKKAVVRAKNVRGSSKPRYANSKSKGSFDSWIELWKHSNPRHGRKVKCSVITCTRDGDLGGHVRFIDEDHPTVWYISPLCPDHNQDQDEGSDIMYFAKESAASAVPVAPKRRGKPRKLHIERVANEDLLENESDSE